MKDALVIGVRDGEVKEVLTFGADYTESREMVAGAVLPGNPYQKEGYTRIELHMISRRTRVKACKVRDDEKIAKEQLALEKAKAEQAAKAKADAEAKTAEVDEQAEAEKAKVEAAAKRQSEADEKAARLAEAEASAKAKAEQELISG